MAKPVDLPSEPKKYAWSKAWAERVQVLNTLVADTVFGIVAFAVVQSAEVGIRTLSAINRACPDFGNLTFADVMHYISYGVVLFAVCRFAVSLAMGMIKDAR